MRSLKDSKYSVRFSAEEHQKFSDKAKEANRPLSTLIRELLESYCNDPSILNPTSPKTDTGVLVAALEDVMIETVNFEQKFHTDTKKEFVIIHAKLNFLLEKNKVSKTEIKKLNQIDVSGESIFE